MKPKKHNHYINLGLDRILPADRLIGVFDIDSTTVQKDTRNFLNMAQKENEIEEISTDLPISFILCDGIDQKQHIIFSSFTLPTLLGRIKRKFP